VTFVSSNFTAYQFTAGIATSSGQVPMTLPVIIPNSFTLVNPVLGNTSLGIINLRIRRVCSFPVVIGSVSQCFPCCKFGPLAL
jgi:hypothetical protein